jgi:hypothetical protein
MYSGCAENDAPSPVVPKRMKRSKRFVSPSHQSFHLDVLQGGSNRYLITLEGYCFWIHRFCSHYR